MTVEFILDITEGSVDAFLDMLRNNLTYNHIDARVIPYLCAKPVQVDVTMYLEGTPKDTRHRFTVNSSIGTEWKMAVDGCIRLFVEAHFRHKRIMRKKMAMKSQMWQEGILPEPYPYHKYPGLLEMHKADKEREFTKEAELLDYYIKMKLPEPKIDYFKKQWEELASKNKSKSLLNKFTDHVTKSSNDLHSAAAIVTKRSRYSGCRAEGGGGKVAIGDRHH